MSRTSLCYFIIFKMTPGRHLEFDQIGNGAVRSAIPENPSLETNGKSIGRGVAEIWPFVIRRNIWLSILSNVRICEYEYQTNLTDVTLLFDDDALIQLISFLHSAFS